MLTHATRADAHGRGVAADRDSANLYLTAVSEAELLYGVAIMPTGRRPNALEAAMGRWLNLGFAHRFLSFDSSSARAYTVIASARRHAGRPIGVADCQIAARSRSHGAVLVTRKVSDFEDTGVDVVGSWTAVRSSRKLRLDH